MGTLLGERGVGFGHPYARANLSHPEMVAGIHEEYLRAGASVIETNTFSANRYKLEIHDLEDRVRQVNVEGARLARRAADTVAVDTLVLGAIGPLGRPLAPIGPVSPEEAREVLLGRRPHRRELHRWSAAHGRHRGADVRRGRAHRRLPQPGAAPARGRLSPLQPGREALRRLRRQARRGGGAGPRGSAPWHPPPP